jgi:hypothetical protein
MAEEVNEGGVTIRVGRVMSGASSHRRFYGYSGAEFVFARPGGGTLSFLIWNDQNVSRLSTLNYLAFVLGDQKFLLESYSTPFDLKEFFTEFPKEYGPGGGSQVQIAIPPGLQSLAVSNEGSETGVEISDVRFSPGGFSGGPVAYRQFVNTTQECEPALGRTLHGERSNQNFYGYSGGEIVLPNRRGGMLTFRYWNDEGPARSSTSNVLQVRVGEHSHFFPQYTTPLEVQEFYKELPKEWGPAGGSTVRVNVPPGIGRVQLGNPASETGIEVSEVQFSTGAALGHDYVYDEHVNWTDRTINLFGRTLTGQRSGKKFFGYSGGAIVLPHRKGGRLSLTAWNDQNRNTANTRNSLRYAYTNTRGAAMIRSTNSTLGEFFVEMPNEWGPGGGRPLTLEIPPGVSRVEFGNEGSETGVEISDVVFRSQSTASIQTSACDITGFQPPNPQPPPMEPPPPPPVQPTRPSTPEVAPHPPTPVRPSPPATPEVRPIPPIPPGSKVLSDNFNPVVCSFTDSSVINLSQPSHVDRVELWYKWANGENSVAYSLFAGKQVLRSGELLRGGCDPYQSTWCVAMDSIEMDLPPGSYTVKAGQAHLCQNNGSQGVGFIRVVGRGTGSVTLSPSATPEVQTVPGVANFSVIHLEGGIKILDSKRPPGNLSVGGGTLRYTEGGKEIVAVSTRDIKEVDVNSVLSIKTAAFHINLVSGRSLNFYVPSLKVDDCVRVVTGLRQAIR